MVYVSLDGSSCTDSCVGEHHPLESVRDRRRVLAFYYGGVFNVRIEDYKVKPSTHFGPKIWGQLKEESNKKKKHFEKNKSTRPFSKDRELRGIVAEEAVARAIHVPRHGLMFDGGIDFFKTDVKGVPPVLPVLSVVPEGKNGKPFKWSAEYYVCVAVCLRERWASIIGWAMRDELKAAPLVQLKHSLAHTLYPWELHPGLPPELIEYARVVGSVVTKP
jgi:hypothetical protein